MLGLVSFQSVTNFVDSKFHQRYHKSQIDPASVSILAFLKIIWPNIIFCANTLHKNNKLIHLICGSQGVKTKICKLSFNSFSLKSLFKSQILTSIISFDHPNQDLCFYGVIFVKNIGKIDRFGQSKIEKIQKLEIY